MEGEKTESTTKAQLPVAAPSREPSPEPRERSESPASPASDPKSLSDRANSLSGARHATHGPDELAPQLPPREPSAGAVSNPGPKESSRTAGGLSSTETRHKQNKNSNDSKSVASRAISNQEAELTTARSASNSHNARAGSGSGADKSPKMATQEHAPAGCQPHERQNQRNVEKSTQRSSHTKYAAGKKSGSGAEASSGSKGQSIQQTHQSYEHERTAMVEKQGHVNTRTRPTANDGRQESQSTYNSNISRESAI